MGSDRTAKNGPKDASDGKDRRDDGHIFAMFLTGHQARSDDHDHRENSRAAHSLKSSKYDPFHPFQYETSSPSQCFGVSKSHLQSFHGIRTAAADGKSSEDDKSQEKHGLPTKYITKFGI